MGTKFQIEIIQKMSFLVCLDRVSIVLFSEEILENSDDFDLLNQKFSDCTELFIFEH